ncbi:hypothetical protein EIP86_003906 [Pleurotus ostreatoroseus]|nr:hypothetical protein EIP86_003906 [Pleurotus ostreatoroseus]
MPCYQGEGDDDDVEVYVWNERLATYVFVPEDETLVDELVIDRGEVWGQFDPLAEFVHSDDASSWSEFLSLPSSPAAVSSTPPLTPYDLSPSPPLSPLPLPALLPIQQPLSPLASHDHLPIIVEESENGCHAGFIDSTRRSSVSGVVDIISGVVC